jgi:alanine dehydrogenase
MRIGVPKEIKALEGRVSVTPGGAQALIGDGHEVLVQRGAGLGSGITDEEYSEIGATLLDTAEDVWTNAEMIVKVKEPLPPEFGYCRSDLTIFTYFHFAAAKELTEAMVNNGATCFTYETLEIDGRLPLLTPMSEVAGRMSIQVGANCLERENGGRGVLLGGVPGVEPANVLVLGGGVVGTQAAWMASGLGASVTIMDIDLERLRYLDDVMPKNCNTVYSDPSNIRARIPYADLVIGGVLLEGARAPVLVPRSYLQLMKDGAVIVDIAVDQGGCCETTKATTHDDPTYVVDGVVHYGVANMPGAVPRTSTFALTNATLPWVRKLATMGAERAIREDAQLRSALNAYKGKITHPGVAEAFSMTMEPAEALV